MWPGWVQGNSNGPLVTMVRLVPMEKHPIPMVLLVNMHPLRGVKMLLPIEIDVQASWKLYSIGRFLLLFHSWCLLLEIECFNFINWVPSSRKEYVNEEKLWLIDRSLDMFRDLIYNMEATRSFVGLHLHCGSLANIT